MTQLVQVNTFGSSQRQDVCVNRDRIGIRVEHGDPVAHEGLSAALGRYPDLEVRDDHSPVDVAVTDYSRGVELAARAPAPSPKVLIVAGIDREWEIRSAMECGVRGYVLVGCALAELVAGVRAVYRGARYLSPQVAARLAESMCGQALTAREEEVMRLVVEGLGNKAIGRQLGIAEGTVKSHLKAAFEKLNVRSRTQAVAAVERRGLLRQANHVTLAAQRLPIHSFSGRLDAFGGGASRQLAGSAGSKAPRNNYPQ
jgi:DNA-binding NarL/FixJ family response regulator